MAYGFTPVSGASTNRQLRPAENQASTSSRFGPRTVAENNSNHRYIIHRENEEQSFTSLTAMLGDRKLWTNFKNNFSLYEPDTCFQLEDSLAAKQKVLENEHFQQLFMLINEVNYIPGVNRGLY